jgi:class 3 adenylate cyclase
MADLPTGTVTFLFTDIEGSTRLWEQYPEAMRQAVARHDALAAGVIDRHAGALIKSRGEGDSLFAVFARATDVVAAAAALQQAFVAEEWPTPTSLRVRLALHTGEADRREGDYYGAPVNRCARLRPTGEERAARLSAAAQPRQQPRGTQRCRGDDAPSPATVRARPLAIALEVCDMSWRNILGLILILFGGFWTVAGGALVVYSILAILRSPGALSGPGAAEYIGSIVASLMLVSPGVCLLGTGTYLVWSAHRPPQEHQTESKRSRVISPRAVGGGVIGALLGAWTGWIGTCLLLPFLEPGIVPGPFANGVALALAIIGLLVGLASARK